MTQAANRIKFDELVSRWITLEETTISEASALSASSKHLMVKAVIDLVKIDSEKQENRKIWKKTLFFTKIKILTRIWFPRSFRTKKIYIQLGLSLCFSAVLKSSLKLML